MSIGRSRSGLENYREAWARILRALPDPVIEFLGPDQDATDSGVLERYEYVRAGQEWLRAIARQSASVPHQLPPISLALTIDSEGRIEFARSLLLETILGVEAARIRECQVCAQIFWAGRQDQACCGLRCAGTLRTRRWRQNYSKYKYRRYQREERASSSAVARSGATEQRTSTQSPQFLNQRRK
jgi:hypothetical protein